MALQFALSFQIVPEIEPPTPRNDEAGDVASVSWVS
jgi:hypothetical protein